MSKVVLFCYYAMEYLYYVLYRYGVHYYDLLYSQSKFFPDTYKERRK